MRPQSVVLFGGTGFIGSHLVARLSEHDVPVVLATRHEQHADHLKLLPGVDVFQANLSDDAALRRLVAGHTAAINLVGILHSSHGTPYGPEFKRAHVELPRRITDACAREGVPRLLHMSALGADPHGPSMYQRSKADGEEAARSQPDVAATIFRPSVVFGPDDHFLNLFARLQRRLPVVPLACAHARFQPVYVGDVVEAFVRVLLDAHTVGNVYELGGPQVYELAELVRLAGRYAGHERPVLALPDGLARLQVRAFALLPGEPIITPDNLDSMKVPNVISQTTKALTAEALGIKLTPLESVAPSYLAQEGRLDVLREHAGR
jgi:NADH dehydrogenase